MVTWYIWPERLVSKDLGRPRFSRLSENFFLPRLMYCAQPPVQFCRRISSVFHPFLRNQKAAWVDLPSLTCAKP